MLVVGEALEEDSGVPVVDMVDLEWVEMAPLMVDIVVELKMLLMEEVEELEVVMVLVVEVPDLVL
jgi:hypothetical protein